MNYIKSQFWLFGLKEEQISTGNFPVSGAPQALGFESELGRAHLGDLGQVTSPLSLGGFICKMTVPMSGPCFEGQGIQSAFILYLLHAKPWARQWDPAVGRKMLGLPF